MYEEDYKQIQGVCARLHIDANAKAVLLIDKSGQLIAEAGESKTLDVTSLASLTAGNVAATGGIARLLSEDDFSGQFHEGVNTHVLINVLMERLILIVLFDHRSSHGLVKLRVRKTHEEFVTLFQGLLEKSSRPQKQSVLSEITDDDIDNLFGDAS